MGIIAWISDGEGERVYRIRVIGGIHTLPGATSFANIASYVEDMDTLKVSVMFSNPVLVSQKNATASWATKGGSISLNTKQILDFV